MNILSSLCLVVTLFLASSVHAQDYVRFRLPQGTRLTVSGHTYQGFDLGEYRELLLMDEDLRYLTALHATDSTRILELTTASNEFRLALASCESQVITLSAERTRLTDLWREENRLRHVAEEHPWAWVPWGIAGAFLVSTITLGIVLGLQ